MNVEIVRVVVRRFRCGSDNDTPSDVVVSQEEVSAPVLKFAVANVREVAKTSAEGNLSDDTCVLRIGFEVFSHGADGTSRDGGLADGAKPLWRVACNLESVH